AIKKRGRNMTNGMRSWNGRKTVLATSVASLLGGGFLFTGVATAQVASPEEEVIVTGSRIRREGYDAPTPTTVVDNTFMDSLGISNVADMITQVPSNVSFFQPENTSGSPFFVGSTLANLRSLNPYY